MARLLQLAAVLRAAGLTVHEVPGWRTRGDDSYGPVRGVIIHETRGSANSSDAGEIDVLVNGRVGLSGPIAQLYLSRTGHWHVVASGACHHVRTGWGGPFSGLGNDALLGIEAAHSDTEDWAAKPVQYWSYVRGVAAILRHTGWPPPVGHKEHQPGDKPDPEFSMTMFRADVAAEIKDGDDDMAGSSWFEPLTQGSPGFKGQTREVALAFTWEHALAARTAAEQALALSRVIASKVDIGQDELDAIEASAAAGVQTAVQAGVAAAADDIVARVLAGIQQGAELTPAQVEQVEQAVRDAFAAGLAPDQAG